ncbi:hypothetical protein HED63_10800 [Ochrobactrum cytisi]|nr:hypothetical protein [Brucella cytisi]
MSEDVFSHEQPALYVETILLGPNLVQDAKPMILLSVSGKPLTREHVNTEM